MLETNTQKWWFFCTFTIVCIVQLFSASQHQVFVDEAFYWLESQHLAWSYSELPGWTQWMIALSQKFLPQSELTIRLPGLFAAFCIPWLAILISRTINSDHHSHWMAGLLSLSLPLLAIAGILAIPDIWIIFFGLLSVWMLSLCVLHTSPRHFLLLGLVLAIGVNIHVRFWIIIALAAFVVLWQFRNKQSLLLRLFGITLPVMLLGFIPVLIFNLQNDFPLLSFQLKDRHPWSFQIAHLKFFVIDVLVATPLVFVLAINSVSQFKYLNPIQRCITIIAVTHWLVYAILGFFSDDVRFNIHWTMYSYMLMMVVAGSHPTHHRLKTWAAATGSILSMSLLMTLYYSMHFSPQVSKTNAQFTENARGWEELAAITQTLTQQKTYASVIADNFMTLAALKFYLTKEVLITSLQHPLNLKHGRQTQLDLMEYTQAPTNQHSLLIVEHSSLKLEQAIPFYQAACETLNGIRMVDTLDYAQGIKSFYFFQTGTGLCEMPPLLYIDTNQQKLTGWIVAPKNQPLGIISNTSQQPEQIQIKTLGNNPLFTGLNADQYQLTEFSYNKKSSAHIQQINITFNNHTLSSQRIEVD